MNHECMPICFWCTKETGKPVQLPEVNGQKPPAKAILNYEPCDACKEMFSHGIHIIGVVDKPFVESMPPIINEGDMKLYPTGAFFVASPEWTEQMLKTNHKEAMIQEVLTRKVMMMPNEIVEKIIAESEGVPAMEVPVTEDEDDASNSN